MKLAYKNSNKNNSSARVVDGKLILSFPEALTPVVWQMDLTQAKASALEVRETKGNFTLTLKTAKGEAVDVASFATKEESVAALMAAAKALENAHGQIRPAGVAANESNGVALSMPMRGGKRSRWTAGFLGVALIVVLMFIWGSLAPRAPMSVGSGRTAATAPGTSQPFGQQGDENGVPLSADEFLLKRQMQ